LLRVERKEIKKSGPIRCTVDLANDPTEISLDENVTRSNLHPADQHEVFRYLAEEKGYGIEEIAARFGVTAHVVRQRLRLASVSPNLIQIYRDGSLTLDQLIAFSIVEDHERQEAAFERLAPNHEPYMIRRVLLEAKVPANDRRARFVGLEAYEAGGGSILRDLFSEGQDGFLEDVVLLDRLTKEKNDGIAARLCEQEGWKWAEDDLDFPHAHGLRRLYPSPVDLSPEDTAAYETAQSAFNALSQQYEDAEELPDDIDERFGELEAEIERLDAKREAYAVDVIACSGAFVVLNHDGNVRIERGFVRREDEKLLSVEQATGAPITDGAAHLEGESPGDEGIETDGKGTPALSDLLTRDLTAHWTLGFRLALGEQPDIALLAAVHALVARTFYRQEVSCLDIRPVSASLAAHAEGIEDTDAAKALAAGTVDGPASFPRPRPTSGAFIAELDHDSRMALFAHCVALTRFAVRAPWEQKRLARATADTVASVLELDMNHYWKPTARSYFGRISKENILAAIREAAGPEAAERIADMKKAAMAEAAEQLLSGTAGCHGS
jgi:ParB family transcriptional regulator, chromosome partitioning protein